MNPNPNPAESNEFGMFAPTSAEEAASQSNTNRTVEVLVDILKPNIPKIPWEEGDNWVRFIDTRGNAWFRDVTYFEMRIGNKLARVAHQDQLFGNVNLLLAVQIGLYQNTQETRRRCAPGRIRKAFPSVITARHSWLPPAGRTRSVHSALFPPPSASPLERGKNTARHGATL